MAIQPATYNIRLQRRADYDLLLRFRTPEADLNLTDWNVYAQTWDRNRTTKYADFTVTYVDRSEGTVRLTLSAAQTTLLPEEAFYDVLLENTTGTLHYYLEGVVYVSEGYTTP
jgi:hypothetical protein